MKLPLLGDTDFARLTPIEQAISLPLPQAMDRTESVTPVRGSRSALEASMSHAVTSDRCYVLFSGGRDSSTLLALATQMARRMNADDPIPVTVRHRNAPLADETEWQDFVLEHLRLREQIVLEFEGEQSLLGDVATSSLRQNGLLWPPAVHLHGAIYRALAPGAVISGEGGDLILSARRITPISSAIAEKLWRGAAQRLPRTIFQGRLGRSRREAIQTVKQSAPWLKPQAVPVLAAALTAMAREPLSWRRGLPAVAGSRAATVGSHNFLGMARSFGLSPVNPFEDAAFVNALAYEGRFRGIGDRTTLMRYLFHDLLPDRVLSRTSKAAFNQTRWTAREREFAFNWNGSGVDERLIDADRLRRAWLDDDPPTLSALQLHAAWLGHNGLPVVPA